ncbi:hypothetical protein GQ44DRAFT_714165 [Phaeosphaeriaceae sp. PMI808]|nr:hypothetical protein GQ44DRAFT_714165 [Phaeosphaeriaceae sp. PMI808]
MHSNFFIHKIGAFQSAVSDPVFLTGILVLYFILTIISIQPRTQQYEPWCRFLLNILDHLIYLWITVWHFQLLAYQVGYVAAVCERGYRVGRQAYLQ